MAGVVQSAGLLKLLEDTKADRNGYQLCLFVNDYVPTQATVIGDLTEASFGGYARITTDSWGTAFINAATIAESDEVLRTFTVTGAPLTQTVYGYFLLDAAGVLIAAERNPAGGTPMTPAGTVYPVWPRITLENA